MATVLANISGLVTLTPTDGSAAKVASIGGLVTLQSPDPVDPDTPRPSHPIALPGDPWWGQDLHPSHPIVLPPTEPPPTEPPPSDTGHWTWAWSPQAGRWVWVKVPAEGEPGPKSAPAV